MIIQFVKGCSEKVGTLTCLRDDGSCTWQYSTPYFAYHDIIHYGVETTLGYQEAFWGLVAQGRDLDAFGTRKGVKDVYTVEEGWAEGIVGSIQWPTIGGNPALTAEELFAMMRDGFVSSGVSEPAVSFAQFALILTRVRLLHAQWAETPAGHMLKLVF